MKPRASTTVATGILALLVCGAARAVVAQDGPLPVQEVADGIFVYQAPYALAAPRNGGAIGNAGFIIGRDGVAVVDTTGSFLAGRRLLEAIRLHTALPIRYVINTHAHPDHILGNAAFLGDKLGEKTVFVGHRNLPDALAARRERYLAAAKELIGWEAFAGTDVISPTLLVSDRLVLDLGDRRLLLEAWPTAHTNADLTIFDERTATWFLGDLLFAGHAPALDGNLAGWIRTIEQLKARNADRVVPGHGPASLPWPAALEPMEDYLRTLRADIRGMIRSGDTMQDAAARAGHSQRSQWSLFDDFNPRNAIAAYHELEWE